jgi:DNA-binding CsgD family transcriptional regulator
MDEDDHNVDGEYDEPRLTRLQLEILAECASGGSMRTASRRLHYSYGIISHQLQRARRTLGATSNSQACLLAYQRGLISCPTGTDLRSVPLLNG